MPRSPLLLLVGVLLFLPIAPLSADEADSQTCGSARSFSQIEQAAIDAIALLVDAKVCDIKLNPAYCSSPCECINQLYEDSKPKHASLEETLEVKATYFGTLNDKYDCPMM